MSFNFNFIWDEADVGGDGALISNVLFVQRHYLAWSTLPGTNNNRFCRAEPPVNTDNLDFIDLAIGNSGSRPDYIWLVDKFILTARSLANNDSFVVMELDENCDIIQRQTRNIPAVEFGRLPSLYYDKANSTIFCASSNGTNAGVSIIAYDGTIGSLVNNPAVEIYRQESDGTTVYSLLEMSKGGFVVNPATKEVGFVVREQAGGVVTIVYHEVDRDEDGVATGTTPYTIATNPPAGTLRLYELNDQVDWYVAFVVSTNVALSNDLREPLPAFIEHGDGGIAVPCKFMINGFVYGATNLPVGWQIDRKPLSEYLTASANPAEVLYTYDSADHASITTAIQSVPIYAYDAFFGTTWIFHVTGTAGSRAFLRMKPAEAIPVFVGEVSLTSEVLTDSQKDDSRSVNKLTFSDDNTLVFGRIGYVSYDEGDPTEVPNFLNDIQTPGTQSALGKMAGRRINKVRAGGIPYAYAFNQTSNTYFSISGNVAHGFSWRTGGNTTSLNLGDFRYSSDYIDDRYVMFGGNTTVSNVVYIMDSDNPSSTPQFRTISNFTYAQYIEDLSLILVYAINAGVYTIEYDGTIDSIINNPLVAIVSSNSTSPRIAQQVDDGIVVSRETGNYLVVFASASGSSIVRIYEYDDTLTLVKSTFFDISLADSPGSCLYQYIEYEGTNYMLVLGRVNSVIFTIYYFEEPFDNSTVPRVIFYTPATTNITPVIGYFVARGYVYFITQNVSEDYYLRRVTIDNFFDESIRIAGDVIPNEFIEEIATYEFAEVGTNTEAVSFHNISPTDDEYIIYGVLGHKSIKIILNSDMGFTIEDFRTGRVVQTIDPPQRTNARNSIGQAVFDTFNRYILIAGDRVAGAESRLGTLARGGVAFDTALPVSGSSEYLFTVYNEGSRILYIVDSLTVDPLILETRDLFDTRTATLTETERNVIPLVLDNLTLPTKVLMKAGTGELVEYDVVAGLPLVNYNTVSVNQDGTRVVIGGDRATVVIKLPNAEYVELNTEADPSTKTLLASAVSSDDTAVLFGLGGVRFDIDSAGVATESIDVNGTVNAMYSNASSTFSSIALNTTVSTSTTAGWVNYTDAEGGISNPQVVEYINASSRNYAFVGGEGEFLRSTDNGATFQQYDTIAGIVVGFASDLTGNTRNYIVTQDGATVNIYQIRGLQDTVTLLGATTATVFCVTYIDGDVYIGSTAGDVLVWDGAFNVVATGASADITAISSNHNDAVIVGSEQGEVYIDVGSGFTEVTIPTEIAGNAFIDASYDRDGDLVALCTTSQAIISTDDGQTWTYKGDFTIAPLRGIGIVDVPKVTVFVYGGTTGTLEFTFDLTDWDTELIETTISGIQSLRSLEGRGVGIDTAGDVFTTLYIDISNYPLANTSDALHWLVASSNAEPIYTWVDGDISAISGDIDYQAGALYLSSGEDLYRRTGSSYVADRSYSANIDGLEVSFTEGALVAIGSVLYNGADVIGLFPEPITGIWTVAGGIYVATATEFFVGTLIGIFNAVILPFTSQVIAVKESILGVFALGDDGEISRRISVTEFELVFDGGDLGYSYEALASTSRSLIVVGSNDVILQSLDGENFTKLDRLDGSGTITSIVALDDRYFFTRGGAIFGSKNEFDSIYVELSLPAQGILTTNGSLMVVSTLDSIKIST